VDRELKVELTLGVALPKGDRQKWLVEKAVELGVTRIVPLRTVRSVAQPVAQALGRLRRSVIEASKQCGRNRLMEIAEPMDWSELIAGTTEVECRLVAHPAGRGTDEDRPPAVSFSRDPVRAGSFLLAVGPEGGFTAEEVALATCAGWRAVDLGPRILRVETAGLVLVTMVLARVQCEGG
jgi:16S rRNA (uracil1498-N3)-methyltransferase